MRTFFEALWNDESGQDMAEYALLLALIAIIVVVTLGPVGNAIASVFTTIKGHLDGAVGGS